jgi:transcription initiation factor TFIIIB Brf1 subunit/transcription initiation factor TFIIB
MIDNRRNSHYKENRFFAGQGGAVVLVTNKMEIEQAWADFDSLRNVPDELIEPALDFYHCSACGGVKSVHEEMPTCTECGRVDAFFLSEEPEWRSGLGEDGVSSDPSRVGAPVNTDLFSASWGQGTFMQTTRFSSYRDRLLSRINLHTSMNHRDRALFHAYADLDRVGSIILKLPINVMYQAKIKYRAFNEAVLTRGAVRNGIKANCIFQACRELGVARTTQEIADAFNIPARDISRTTEIFQEQVPESEEVRTTGAGDLIPRFLNEIKDIPDGQRGRIKMTMIRMCVKLNDCVELMGRTPKAVACTVMYRVLTSEGLSPNKATICKICDVSVPTLGKIDAIVKESGLV